jgi:hypothetical protein
MILCVHVNDYKYDNEATGDIPTTLTLVESVGSVKHNDDDDDDDNNNNNNNNNDTDTGKLLHINATQKSLL